MLIRPSRRDLIRYGIGAAAFSKMQASVARRIYGPGGTSPAVTLITIIGSTKWTGAANTANTVTTDALDTTGATLLVVATPFNFSTSVAGVSPVVTDSKSNTWTQIVVMPTTNSTQDMAMWYVNSATPTVGSGHTFTSTKTGAFPGMFAIAFAGTSASPLDLSHIQNGGPNTAQPGSLTPSANNYVFVTATGGDSNAGTYSIDSGFTMAQHKEDHNFPGAIGYFIQTTAAAKNPTWTNGNQTGMTCGMATFKHA